MKQLFSISPHGSATIQYQSSLHTFEAINWLGRSVIKQPKHAATSSGAIHELTFEEKRECAVLTDDADTECATSDDALCLNNTITIEAMIGDNGFA